MIKKKHVKNHTTRETALSLLARVEHGGAFADRVLAAPQVSNMEERDRLFIRELLLGVLRWKLRLDRIIETFYNKNLNSLDPEICNILRLGLFQLMFMGSVPDWAAVNESVTLAHDHRGERAAGLVNAILRRFSREGEPPFPDEPSERLSFETSHPLWLW
ncbi:MAG: 16S rRNA (cytosine(967)-C(5))-methyltransferase, partial [Candidatus Latescibacteria bacterium]|nr:16S rRNA (cytosine(967)-C(5))-methyltransferase [Candidatus Latescibacterota bacterium]